MNTNCKPVIDVHSVPENIAILKFNFDGASTWFDMTEVVQSAQTDTSLSANEANRAVVYKAEKHTDTITSAALGAIIHLSDLGDIDGTAVSTNSLLVRGALNTWVAWNATSNGSDSADNIIGIGNTGGLVSLSAPANTNQYYQLGWNSSNKIGFSQPVNFANTTGKSAMYIDNTTKQIGYVTA